MNRKKTAVLLNALVLPGLGQIYLGRKVLGLALLLAINMLLLLALFLVFKALGPIIATKAASGAMAVTVVEVRAALSDVSGPGKILLAAFFMVWFFSLVDVLRPRDDI